MQVGTEEAWLMCALLLFLNVFVFVNLIVSTVKANRSNTTLPPQILLFVRKKKIELSFKAGYDKLRCVYK